MQEVIGSTPIFSTLTIRALRDFVKPFFFQVKHTYSQEEEDKVRLLVNPCLDNPEEHFVYDNENAVIQPLMPKGEKSIDVYVL